MSTDSSNGSLIRIGDLARLTGKTTRAIHLYEELGLLKPATRSSGGFRLYESRAVDRVRWIELLHGMGFSLQEMKEVLEAWWKAELGPNAMSRLRGLFQTKLRETRDAVERHRQIERELLEGLAYLETCKVCGTHESSSGCVGCTQDHGMEAEPALLAGITQGRANGRAGRVPGLVKLEEIERPAWGRGRSNEPSERSTRE
jgi:DNA-binding transcriptional MerR regulator